MFNRFIISFAAVLLLGAAPAMAQIATPAVKADLEQRIAEVGNPEYFSIFSRDLTPEQREALEVLYAYMPLPDITDNSQEFFIENVDVSLKALKEMPWGSSLPMREFRHFVLPIRINDEALDSHRRLFYDELKDRVKGLSMTDAILEINHWCHEKATYQPSDSRTHSPLATVYTAIGRCGEESTFTVAALRAMGIPARQVYTPRWAHTDDNHAWVEAWADGKWYFLGACEPEAVLNLGWFNAPAARGMLMNTRVFGNYDGDEETLLRIKGYTDINVTSNYAPTSTIDVTVVDVNGNPVANADVKFRLYNYAEFYPIVSKVTDTAGQSSLVTGLGDIVVWASNGSDYGFTKGSVGNDKHITVVLNRNNTTDDVVLLDVVPPPAAAATVVVDLELAAINDRRKAQEDSIRTLYTSSFLTPEQAKRWGANLGVDPETFADIMSDARGNHQNIVEFMRQTHPADRQRAMALLQAISAKDRSDVPVPILLDHMKAMDIPSPLADEYILNPRIDNEALTPYRTFFYSVMPAAEREMFRLNPQLWVKWVADNIAIVPSWSPVRVRMSPQAVWEGRSTNEASRNIFFVAAARSMGIPARIDPVTGKTQWADSANQWIDADFGTAVEARQAPQGTLFLTFEPTSRVVDPKYYSQFSLSKIVDGQPQLLNYPDEATWSQIFKDGEKLDEGQYLLVTGQRMADGGVLSRLQFFNIEADKNTTIPLIVRQDDKGVQVIGNFDAETLYHDNASNTHKGIISTTGRGYYVLGVINANHEPSNHALRDIAALTPDFNDWGKSMMLIFRDPQQAATFDVSAFPELPSTVTFGTDIDGQIAAQLIEALNLPSTEMPIFVIADTFNRIVFVSQGYTIGLGEQLIDVIHQLKE